MTFRVKPITEPRAPRTGAQVAQQERAFRIFRLRGLWYMALILRGLRRRVVQHLIDDEIEMLGAEREDLRCRKRTELREDVWDFRDALRRARREREMGS